MAPTARFIGGYANWRFNPFTDADMSVDKTEDHVPIPSGAPFLLQLLEVPRKDGPSTVSVYCYTDAIYFSETAGTPAQAQFRVDYPPTDGHGTALIEFNSNDASKDIRVVYKGTGSPAVAEFLNTFVPWPSASPGENQVVIFKSSVPTWAYLPKRYFHDDDALFHASGESQSPLLFRFKKGANDSKILLELKGALVHQGRYTELKEHAHAAGGIVTTTAGSHGHTIPSHDHDSSLTGTQPEHRHGVLDGDTPSDTQLGGGEAVGITGDIWGSGQLNTNAGGSHDHSTFGDSGAAGGSPKTYPDQLKVYVDGVDKTANILTLSGLPKLGDGTSGHAFVTAGTGEMDITSLLAGGVWHDIMVTEPIAAKGGRVLLHLEVY